jgi:hypothetical protein
MISVDDTEEDLRTYRYKGREVEASESPIVIESTYP